MSISSRTWEAAHVCPNPPYSSEANLCRNDDYYFLQRSYSNYHSEGLGVQDVNYVLGFYARGCAQQILSIGSLGHIREIVR